MSDRPEELPMPTQLGTSDPERLIAALAAIQADASLALATEEDPDRRGTLDGIRRTAEAAIRDARGM